MRTEICGRTANRIVEGGGVRNPVELLKLVRKGNDLCCVAGWVGREWIVAGIGAIRKALGAKATDVSAVGIAFTKYRDAGELRLRVCASSATPKQDRGCR